MPRFVLVTRPAEDAAPLAAEIRKMGFTPLLAPMLEIKSMPDIRVPDETYDVFVFTSANAVRHLPPSLKVPGMRVFTVGERTAAVARAGGFKTVIVAGGDIESLNTLLLNSLPSNAKILHIAGRHVAGEVVCPTANIVHRLAVYEAMPTGDFTPALRDALSAGSVAAALFYSARSAERFAALIRRDGLELALKPIKALCMSDSVLESLSHFPWQCLQVSARPDQQAMLDLLKAELLPDR